MYLNCSVCGKTFETKKFKGMRYEVNVCSNKCLKEFLKSNKMKDKDFKELFNFNSSNKVMAYHNEGYFADSRSKAEVEFKKLMEKNDIKFEYEPYSLEYRKRLYLPDFFLPEYNIFIEVKDGVWEAGAYSKLKTFYNKVKLFLMTGNTIRRLLNE